LIDFDYPIIFLT